jgi:hypothetical protein
MHSVMPVPLHKIMELFAQPISQVLRAHQKQRLKNGVGTKFVCLKCKKSLNQETLKQEKLIIILYGVLPGPQKMNVH